MAQKSVLTESVTLQYHVCDVQLQVLIDDSARLQDAYPGGNADHIASQQAMVVDNWDILQQKSAQRKSDLQATMDLYWFLNAVCYLYIPLHTCFSQRNDRISSICQLWLVLCLRFMMLLLS